MWSFSFCCSYDKKVLDPIISNDISSESIFERDVEHNEVFTSIENIIETTMPLIDNTSEERFDAVKDDIKEENIQQVEEVKENLIEGNIVINNGKMEEILITE